MSEVYFLGVDIVEATKNMMKLIEITCTDGMTENELKAYKMGIENAMSALKTIVQESEMPVINIDGLDVETELTMDELQEYCLN